MNAPSVDRIFPRFCLTLFSASFPCFHSSALAYWNSPQGKRDEEFSSPFHVTASPGKRKYLTFEPDTVSILSFTFHIELHVALFIIVFSVFRCINEL